MKPKRDKSDHEQARAVISALPEGCKLNRRGFMTLLAGAGVSAAGIRKAFAHWTDLACNVCHSQAPAPPGFVRDINTDQLVQQAKNLGIEIIYDRGTPCTNSHFHDKAGNAGLCCFRCQMGPCTLGEGSAMYERHPELTHRGCCGADRDIIVTRDLVRRIAGGASAHIEHARACAITLLLASEVGSPYHIKEKAKLKDIFVGLKCPGFEAPQTVPLREKAKLVAQASLGDLGRSRGVPKWLRYKANPERKKTWRNLGIMPTGGSTTICEAEHRTTLGVDADMTHLASCGLKLGLVDGYCGSHMASGLQDVMFGTPTLVEAKANLAVIEPDRINLVLHGHEPILAEKILQAADKYNRSLPETPINVVGMCCTGNELLMRQGVNLAGGMVQQELAIVTGAVEAMVVDVQCIIPNVQRVAEKYHTKIITTHPHAHITGAERIVFDPENANAIAKQIIDLAVGNYIHRDPLKVFIPTDPPKTITGGFSLEQIAAVLQAVEPNDPVGLIVDLINADPNLASASIRGIVAMVGCLTPLDTFGYRHVALARRLLQENILIVGTGCWAHAAGQFGLLAPDSNYPGVGPGLKSALQSLASANGLTAVAACWHMGSCVDNSRIEDLLNLVAGHSRLDCRIDQLPVVASAPELITEKAVSIGAWAVDLGLFTHIGSQPYVSGSPNLVTLLTDGIENLVGGKFYIEKDPEIAADQIIAKINQKRSALSLPI